MSETATLDLQAKEHKPAPKPVKGKKNGLVTVEPTPLAPRDVMTPDYMLAQAIAGGNVEVVERMMGLKERWEANQARRAFDNAIAEAKSELPIIIKGNSVSFGAGKTSYKYEDLASIAKAIDPILAERGLSYRFRTASEPGFVTVICRVAHRSGHAEENSLTGPVDTSGGKNAIQSIGSTVTYLSRYTLKAALGLAASADTDANRDFERDITGPISIDQLAALNELFDKLETGVEARFCGHFKIEAPGNLPAAKYASAISSLTRKVEDAIAAKAAQGAAQ